MGKLQMARCPRCEGRLFIDRDEDGWYEQCLSCAYRHELKVAAQPARVPAAKFARGKAETLKSA